MTSVYIPSHAAVHCAVKRRYVRSRNLSYIGRLGRNSRTEKSLREKYDSYIVTEVVCYCVLFVDVK